MGTRSGDAGKVKEGRIKSNSFQISENSSHQEVLSYPGLRGTHLSQCCGWREADEISLGGFSPGQSWAVPQKRSGQKSGQREG